MGASAVHSVWVRGVRTMLNVRVNVRHLSFRPWGASGSLFPAHKFSSPSHLVGHPTISVPMPRVETRVTSVQVVPGFPACFAIPNPPGWDPLSLGYGSSDASAHTPNCQSQARDVGEDIDDLWFSSTPDIFWPSDLSPPRPHTANVETLPALGTGEVGTPVDSASIETTSYQQSVAPFSLHVSWTVPLSR